MIVYVGRCFVWLVLVLQVVYSSSTPVLSCLFYLFTGEMFLWEISACAIVVRMEVLKTRKEEKRGLIGASIVLREAVGRSTFRITLITQRHVYYIFHKDGERPP